MNFAELFDKVREVLGEIEKLPDVHASQVDLDIRCGRLLIGDGFVVSFEPRLLEYYGGFEYIPAENRLGVGHAVVYFDHPRVEEVLNAFEETNTEDYSS